MDEQYIDTQNKAYLFLAKKQTEEIVTQTVNGLLISVNDQTNRLLANDIATLEQAKQYTDSMISGKVSPCLAEENSVSDQDYPLGSFISVSVTCSQEEGRLPYLENGPKVNSTLNNIYLNILDTKSGQVFHWFDGKEVFTNGFIKMPGVWRSRGICGGFSNEVVGFKYYLAQRVQ
jgi:hypothetical protein